MERLNRPQRRNNLSLKLLKHPLADKELPTARQIEVAEIHPNVEDEHSNKSTIRGLPDRTLDVSRSTRIAMKKRSMHVS